MVHVGVNAGILVGVAADLASLIADLEAEQDDLHGVLASLPAGAWEVPTPAPGWTVLHQVRHLAHGEALGRLAVTEPASFATELERLLRDLDGVERDLTAPRAADPPAVALTRWRAEARGLRAAVAAHPRGSPIPWVTGPMAATSFVTARLMETFAHGHDIAEAVGVRRPPSDRLRHVAHLGVATRHFSFANRGLEAPEAAVRVELAGDDGQRWAWGDPGAPERVTGPLLDFCLVVTRRRPVADTALQAEGAGAARWLEVAQCYAGPPGAGPPPRT